MKLTAQISVGLLAMVMASCDREAEESGASVSSPAQASAAKQVEMPNDKPAATASAAAVAESSAVRQQILKIAEDVLHKPSDELDPSSPLQGPKNSADALDVTQLVMEIADRLNVEIPDKDLGPDGPATKSLTLDQIVKLVEAKKSNEK